MKVHNHDYPDHKTARQWAKQGFLPIDGAEGIELWANQFCQNKYIYYGPDEVSKATPDQLSNFFRFEREKRNQREKEKRKHRNAELIAENKELRKENNLLELSLCELERTAIRLMRNVDIAPEKSADTIIIDTETTGLSELDDELLQVSIIDDAGNVLYNSYLRPLYHTSWDEAECVNNITPRMVAEAPTIYDEMPKINAIIKAAKKIIGFNTGFDENFLYFSGGISWFEKEVIDVMTMFAPIYGEWSEQYDDYKWQNLVKAADYYDYDWNSRPGEAHNSLADCYATLHVYNKITADRNTNLFLK